MGDSGAVSTDINLSEFDFVVDQPVRPKKTKKSSHNIGDASAATFAEWVILFLYD